MKIKILVEINGIRASRMVEAQSTRNPHLNIIHWHGPANRHDPTEYFSVTHVGTGRACNQFPLTLADAELLVDALADCPIEWERIRGDRWPGKDGYIDRLTPEADYLAITGESVNG